MKKRLIACFLAVIILFAYPVTAREMNVSELRQIAMAGGSIIVDLDRKRYSVSELVQIASELSHGATLTIRAQDGILTVSQCLQIARAKPGQVKFWF